MDIADETLMALADGEIIGEEAKELESRIAADPDLAARYALYTETARLMQAAAFADPRATVSADLTARIRDMAAAAEPATSNVVPLRPARPAWQPMALAASLALAVGLSAGFLLAPAETGPESNALAFSLTGDLGRVLGNTPSGDTQTLDDGRNLSIISSFTDPNGNFCREYEVTPPEGVGFVNVACRAGETWGLRFAMAQPGESDAYTPASSLEALDAFLTATGASAPLSPEEESRFLE